MNVICVRRRSVASMQSRSNRSVEKNEIEVACQALQYRASTLSSATLSTPSVKLRRTQPEHISIAVGRHGAAHARPQVIPSTTGGWLPRPSPLAKSDYLSRHDGRRPRDKNTSPQPSPPHRPTGGLQSREARRNQEQRTTDNLYATRWAPIHVDGVNGRVGRMPVPGSDAEGDPRTSQAAVPLTTTPVLSLRGGTGMPLPGPSASLRAKL